MLTWEYRYLVTPVTKPGSEYLHQPDEKGWSDLNYASEWGRDGWEVVSVAAVQKEGGKTDHLFWVFKRPITD